MPRPPRSRQPIKDAALQLFVDKGIHATGVRDIALAAGCSEAALYRHWTNKDDLVAALFREHVSEVVTLLEGQLFSKQSASTRLKGALKALYNLYDQQPHVFRFVLLVQHELGPYLPPETRMPQTVIAEFVATARGPLVKHIPVPLLAAALVGLFIECSSRVIYGHLEGPMQRYSEEVAELCLRLLDLRG